MTQEYRTGHYIPNLFYLSFYFWTGKPTVSSVLSHGTFKKLICRSRELNNAILQWKMSFSYMFLSCKWNIARYISENNECINLVKHPLWGQRREKDQRAGFLHTFLFFSYILQISTRQALRFSYVCFYFPFSFNSTVLVRFFHDISVIKAKWHIPRLSLQLLVFNSIQSKCPVQLLAVTATKAICHNRDKRNI